MIIALTLGKYISRFSGVASSERHRSSTSRRSSGTDMSSLAKGQNLLLNNKRKCRNGNPKPKQSIVRIVEP